MWKYVSLVWIGACSFGILSSFVKLSLEDGYTAGEVTGVQVFFGMLTLWMLFGVSRVAGWIRRPEQSSAKRKDAPWKVMLVGCSTGLVSITYYQCIALLPASVAIVLLMQFVWIGVLLEYILFRNRPSRLQLLSVVFVLGGTLLAAGLFNEEQIVLSVRGIVFGLLAATFYAVFLLVMARYGNAYPAIQKSALMLTGACLIVFMVFPPTFLLNGVLISGLWKWGLILALLGTVIPPLFFAIGTPRIGVTMSSIISAVELPVAVGMSFFVLLEEVSVLQWVGVALIVGAIVISKK